MSQQNGEKSWVGGGENILVKYVGADSLQRLRYNIATVALKQVVPII